jgi:bifunctional non-homologous end joining protein LigD
VSADAPRRDGRRLSLDEYGRKRRFERTPEPPALVPEGRGDGAVFVVHRHDARRLHWDLRLEMEGVLRSWAVPKGFSYDPRDKHLAIRTEDHPLAYGYCGNVMCGKTS